MSHRRGVSRRRFCAIRAIVSAATAVAAVACTDTRQSPAAPALVALRVGVAGASTTNPTTGLRQLSQNLSVESLLRPGPDGRLQPLLADSWTVAEDGSSVVVHIRSGVRFHDGSPLDSATLAAVLPDAMRSLMGPLYADIESVSALGSDQVEIRFRRPSPFLFEAFEVSVRKPGPSVAGTGPYVAAAGSTTEFQANPDYYLGPPTIDRIVLSNYPTVRAAWAELLRDKLDMLYEVGNDALDSMEGSNNVSVFTFTRPYQYVVLLNTQTPALRAREIRRALNLAVDRAAIVKDALRQHGIVSQGPVSPRYWALPRDAPRFDHDPIEAKRLLDLRAGGERGERVRFTCLVPPDAVNERIALALKQQLTLVGVDMNVEQVPQDQIIQRTARRDYDAALFEGVSGPTLLRAYYFWHSNTTFNSGGWGSPAIDATLDRARHAPSETEYTQAVAALQRDFVDDPPAIFLAWSVTSRAITRRFVVPPVEPGRDVLGNLRLMKPADGPLDTSRD